MKFIFVSHVPLKAFGQIIDFFHYYISEFFLYTMIYVYGKFRFKYSKRCNI